MNTQQKGGKTPQQHLAEAKAARAPQAPALDLSKLSPEQLARIQAILVREEQRAIMGITDWDVSDGPTPDTATVTMQWVLPRVPKLNQEGRLSFGSASGKVTYGDVILTIQTGLYEYRPKNGRAKSVAYFREGGELVGEFPKA